MGLVTVTFILSHVIPGDPVGLAAGEAAPERTRRCRKIDDTVQRKFVENAES